MLREIGGTRNLALWRAWYAMEPRGESRGDMQAALAASAFCGEPVGDLADSLRSNWEPDTPAAKFKRRSLKEIRDARKAKEGADKVRSQMGGGKRGKLK